GALGSGCFVAPMRATAATLVEKARARADMIVAGKPSPVVGNAACCGGTSSRCLGRGYRSAPRTGLPPRYFGMRRPLFRRRTAFPALQRRRIEDQPVGGPPLVAFRQVLGDRQPLRGDEQQAVAVFPPSHLVAGAQPPAAVLRKLPVLVRVEVAGAQGA